MNTKTLKQFVLYIDKVYNFHGIVKEINDFRKKFHISAQIVFLAVFFMFVLRMRSFNQIEKELKEKQMRKLIKSTKGKGEKICSADTLGYSLSRFDLVALREGLGSIAKRIKRNKAYEAWKIGDKILVSVDGFEINSSEKRCCKECLERNVWKEVNGEKIKVKEYYHQAVGCQVVGTKIRTILDFELMKQGEDEVSAAIRLMERVCRNYPRYFDIVVIDALYAKAPFINFLVKKGKEIVVRLKDKRMEIYKDAEGLFKDRSPNISGGKDYSRIRGEIEYEIWEDEEFRSWENVEVPLRVVKIHEKSKKKVRRGKEKKVFIEEGEQMIWCATTLAKKEMKAISIRKIIHLRWEIENNGMKDLKNEWHMDHYFIHHPIAIEALLLILAIAFNLFYAFMVRNLKEVRFKKLTALDVVRALVAAYYRLSKPLYKYYWAPG